jgi:uncharacterized protein YciI
MKTRPAHLEWVAASNFRFKFAGPILSDNGLDMIGSVIIAEHNDLDEARALQKTDPYEKAGLFERVIIQPTVQMHPKPAK